MALLANGDLLSIDRSQNSVETCRFLLVGQFPNMADVMHDNLSCTFSANTARPAKLGTGSHRYRSSYLVNIAMLSFLKSISFLGPVMIEVEVDRSIFFSLFSFDDDGEPFAKALKHLGQRDFEFLCECFSK